MRRSIKLSVAIPSSLVSELSDLRDKTRAIGEVGRTAAIYRVDDIYVYRDAPDEGQLIRSVLSYMETPQYLRRRLIKKRPELRYAGVLPPLRTPHHPLNRESARLVRGEFREGVVVSEEAGYHDVDIGVERPIKAEGRAPSIGSRATVRVTQVKPELRGSFVGGREVDLYWGYGVHVTGTLGELASRGLFDLKVATSRHAPPYTDVEPEIRPFWTVARRVLIAFGSPRRGLVEILAQEGQELGQLFHFAVNTVPGQGCETVRTEEALHATLAVLNLLDYRDSV
ncbi:MAG: hypothetical protein JSV27_00330 [Candidatus Bathyarchaeota archaeon]|nr:MAG: hypothetical protein JSV27_00330 [Candidatus Bathyarchaeota archaeon]